MTRVRIVDVARAAEVSPATVSNALNNTGKMTEGTRARVRTVAASMGYPSPAGARRGRGPAGTRMLALGVTTHPDLSWSYAEIPYYAQAISAATAAAHARGFGLTVVPALAGGAGWREVAADGVLLLDSPRQDPVACQLATAHVPLAFDGRPDPAGPPGRYWVDNDHDATMRVVLDHLASAGARRIALLSGEGTDAYTVQSQAAYLRWCARHRQPAIVATAEEPREGAAAAEALLRSPQRPDAIYGLYSFAGDSVLTAAREVGLRVPEDLLVACAGEESGHALASSPVTTFTLSPRARVWRATNGLAELVAHGRTRPPLTVPAVLRVRRSTGGVASPAGRPAPQTANGSG